MDVASLISGGKDSLFASYVAMQFGWDVKYFLSVIPDDIHSCLFHGLNLHLLDLISKLTGKPVIRIESKGNEVEDLIELLKRVDVEGVVNGAVASDYQRTRFNHACKCAGKKSFTPIWHKDPEKLLELQTMAGFRFLIVASAAEGLEKWLGKEIGRENVRAFIEDCKRLRVHPCGEGGEYETFVLECPLYKGKMILREKEFVREGDFSYVILKKVDVVESF
ncbi:MAG: diphthine--ammonia ligase [Thermoplasmata archaeon]|nr:MAG: diphthine--ammonia ligase [Thermoplasmata archaeon]